MLKAISGGYDGKAVWVCASPHEAAEVVAEASGRGLRLLAEEFVAFDREVAAVVARSPFGQGAAWPVVQTVQQDGICVEVLAPAPDLGEELSTQAQNLALRLARAGRDGVLAVELFETADGLVVNELAMRPHNSAHWTIEGAPDVPVRAASAGGARLPARRHRDGPRGRDGQPPRREGPALDERVHHMMARWPGVKLHLYGKSRGRGASSGTSPRSATTRTRSGRGRRRRRTGCATATRTPNGARGATS